MRLVRQAHLWLSVFFAPSIVFFAISGLVLLMGWHDGAAPSKMAVTLAQVHRAQTTAAPPARPRPPQVDARRRPDNLGVDRAAAARPAPPPRPHRSAPLTAFFVAMTLTLVMSTALGVAIAWSFRAQRRAVLATLAAGAVIPLVLVWL